MSQPPEDQTIALTQDKPKDSEALTVASEHVAEDTGSAPVARVATPLLSPAVDRDAQDMVIDSLRTQVQDLFSQVTQLNGKLVQSYDRVSDLEDSLHAASSTVRSSALQISQLELERTQHLSALNTGLLVEKSQVTAELSRVMEKATEEAARRGQAESARADIEKDLDDLSASLFNQANNMVAQARFQQASSERKVEEAERALKGAEEAVTLMQQQMQGMQVEREKTLERMEELQDTMGKGKWVDRERSPGVHASVRLLSLHTPYQEFLQFVAHLRSISPTSQQPPAMTTLLPLPFLARLQLEDSDPTIRLDLAPSLNWLSRRSVLGAIHTGELSIEPMGATAMVQELSFGSYSTAALASAIIPGSSHTQNILCALCGTAIFPLEPKQSQRRPPIHPVLSRAASGSTSWSTSLFKNSRSQVNETNSAPISPTSAKPPTIEPLASVPTQVFIFRVTTQTGATPQSPNAVPQRSTIYPLCTSGWCLARLRSTCSLWSFVRNGIVERVWEEEISSVPLHAPVPQRAASRDSVSSLTAVTSKKTAGAETSSISKASTTTAKRSKIGNFWGMASNALSAGVERVSSISQTDAAKEQEKEKDLPQTPPRRNLPPPPPPLSPKRSPRHRSPVPADGLSPPPLPKGSGVRKPHADGNDETPSKEPISSPSLSTTSNFATPQEELDTNPLSPPIEPPVMSPFTELHAPILLQDKREPDATAAPEPTTVTAPEPAAVVAPEPATSSPLLENPYSPSSPKASPETPSAPPPNGQPATEASSPATTNTPREASPAPAPALPSRMASPARQPPRVPSRTSSPVPAPGSRGNSPAPPPLPRRAAARARPPSMVIQATTKNATASAGSLPSPRRLSTPQGSPKQEAPASPARTATPADGRPKTPLNAAKEVAVPEPETPKASTAAEATSGSQLAPDAVESAKEERSEALPASPPAPPPRAEAGPPVVESESSNVGSPETKTVVPAAAEPQNKVDGDADVEATPPPVYTATPAAALPKADSIETNVDQEKLGPAQEAYVGSYVGDATWEERTWKELVRLRESMFWARVGGVR